MKSAIKLVFANHIYLSNEAKKSLTEQSSYEINDFDISIIKFLSEGMTQKMIFQYLAEQHITPSSISTIEKKLNNLRETLSVKNNHQLVAVCKDLGII